MKKLYVKNDDGSFEEVSALLAGPNLKAIKKTTIKDAFSRYIKIFSSNKKSFKAEKIWFNEFKIFLDEHGLRHLDDINQHHIELFQYVLLKKKSAASSNRQFTTYSHFFKKCVEFNYILESPLKNFKKKKEVQPIRTLWTGKEIDSVLKNSPPWFKFAFMFLALTGARPIELCNLRKRHHSVNDSSVRLFCDKSMAGSRLLPISQPAQKIILSLCKNLNESDFVFRSSVNTKLSTDRLNKTLAKIQKRHGLKRIPIYSLRHTYATDLCNKGINIEIVRKLLGHSQIRTTQKYIKIDFLELKKVVNGG